MRYELVLEKGFSMSMDFVPEMFEKDSAIEPDYVIDAVIEFEETLDMAAALQIEKNKVGIPLQDRISEEQLAKYQDFIDTVYSVVDSRFGVVRERQSNESYSYYLDFEVRDFRTDENKTVRIRFRISNHVPASGRDSIGKMIFKTFIFGGAKYSNTFELLGGVEQACDALERGDYDRFERL